MNQGRSPPSALPTNAETSRRQRLLSAIGFGGLAFMALFATTDFGGQLKPEYGVALALLALLGMGGRPWRELARHPFAWCVLVFFVYGFVQAGWAAQLRPDILYRKQLQEFAEPLQIGVFACVVGAWLAHDPRWLPRLLWLMVAGFAAAVAVQLPWERLDALVLGSERLRLNYAENIVGMHAGAALAIVAALAPSAIRGIHGGRRTLMITGCALISIAALAALLFSQSRGAWLTVALVALATAIVSAKRLLAWLRQASLTRRIGALVLAGTLVAAAIPFVAQRMPERAGDLLTSVLNGDYRQIPHRGTGLRLHFYRLGYQRWSEQPLLGWGLASISPMIAEEGLNRELSMQHKHLHSAYLDVLVGLGLIGIALMACGAVIMLRDAARAHRMDRIDLVSLHALLAALGVVLTCNLFDSMGWRFDYTRAPLILLLGGCLAASLLLRRRADPASAPPPRKGRVN